MIYIAILFILSLLIFMVLKHNKKSKEGESKVEVLEKDMKEVAITYFLPMNINVRLLCKNDELISRIEILIDNLINVTDLVNKKEHYSENTPLINRINAAYLPRLIQSFISLPDDKKEEQKTHFLSGLESIEKTVIAAQNSIVEGNIAEFTKQANFMKSFFEGDYSGGSK